MLRTEGQSSEHTESDENESLVTYVPFYRRRIVGQILCEVDQETAALKLRTTQSKGKQRRVHSGRIHRRSNQRSHHSVVRNLPAALYHRRYLSSLTPYDKELLRLKKDFSLPMLEKNGLFDQDSDSEMDEDVSRINVIYCSALTPFLASASRINRAHFICVSVKL